MIGSKIAFGVCKDGRVNVLSRRRARQVRITNTNYYAGVPYRFFFFCRLDCLHIHAALPHTVPELSINKCKHTRLNAWIDSQRSLLIGTLWARRADMHEASRQPRECCSSRAGRILIIAIIILIFYRKLAFPRSWVSLCNFFLFLLDESRDDLFRWLSKICSLFYRLITDIVCTEGTSRTKMYPVSSVWFLFLSLVEESRDELYVAFNIF